MKEAMRARLEKDGGGAKAETGRFFLGWESGHGESGETAKKKIWESGETAKKKFWANGETAKKKFWENGETATKK